jgi:hypothetical protein
MLPLLLLLLLLQLMTPACLPASPAAPLHMAHKQNHATVTNAAAAAAVVAAAVDDASLLASQASCSIAMRLVGMPQGTFAECVATGVFGVWGFGV